MNLKVTSAFQAIALASLIAVLSSCSREPRLAWTSDMIVGLTLETIDPPGKALYSFAPDGYVSVTSVSAEGEATAPVFEWRIVSGRLHIDDSGYSEELTLVSHAPAQIVAKWSSGRVVRFRVLNYE